MNSSIMNLRLLISGPILLSFALSACSTPRTSYQPDYMVNAAMVCDYDYRTPTLSDDCDRVSGYYYHPGSYHLYWRPVGAPAVMVYDNYRVSTTTTYTPGRSVRLNEPIATSASGQPVRDKSGKVRTGPKGSNYNSTPLSSQPKAPSSYKPTVAKPSTAQPSTAKPAAASSTQPASTGSTGSVKSGSMSKPAAASSTAKPASKPTSKPAASSTSPSTSKPAVPSTSKPVRSGNSSSFKPSSSKSSGGRSSGGVRGGSFGSSRGSGG